MLRLMETMDLALTQRIQYVYSVLAIEDPLVVSKVDWCVFYVLQGVYI